ncbi:NYN domain-containing protein [Chitinilyticum piscinae]|uniref:NYN domain-containing protein n=1 Tax=Chitinilyticum piscinae TaxID=2866724 RepID=A0A8J7FJR8_9NEIS|nr:NYN domain-containing protein [Chitinilyticum piscinae]MBE9609120.1 NYN domain-containing protein [Chitinilyticum piscinae]
MKDLTDHKKIAILIDADNAQHSKIKTIFSEISKHGHIITKRAYGDWSSEYLKNWKTTLNEMAIQPIQQFAYTTGKNATDSSLIIDAMDLLYTDKYDAFAIISSDSDFTKLASRLRESEVYVFGIGERKTPISFRNSCDDFIFTENLDDLTVTTKIDAAQTKATPTPEEKIPQEIIDILFKGWEQFKDDDDWANVAPVGQLLKRVKPDFDPRTYGASKVPEVIAKLDQFEMTKFKGKGVVNIVAYRPKKANEPSAAHL